MFTRKWIIVSAPSPWGALSMAMSLVRRGFTICGRLRRTLWLGTWWVILLGPERPDSPATLWGRRRAA
jgi:hypothetical protein